MSFIIFTDNQTACGITVNTVDNTGTQSSVYSGKAAAAMIHDGIHQRTAVVPRRRMNHHPFRLVYHQNILIFIKNIQRNVFRPDIRFNGFRKGKADIILRLQTIVGFYGRAVDQYLFFFQHFLDKGTRQRIDKRCHILIDSFLFIFFSYLKPKQIRHTLSPILLLFLPFPASARRFSRISRRGSGSPHPYIYC